MSSDPVALSYVLSFIAEHAGNGELDSIVDAARARRRALADLAGAQITVGVSVRLGNLRPAYLNGLTGTVTERTTPRRGAKPRCTIRLDPESVRRLAFADTQYTHLHDQTSFDLGGIPAAACHLTDRPTASPEEQPLP